MRPGFNFSVIRYFIIFVALAAFSNIAHAQISTSVTFAPADPVRDYMDVGGTWDGSSDVTASGDRFEISVGNTDPTETIFLTAIRAEVPADFDERTSSLNVSFAGTGCGAAPSISASRAADTITFNLGAAEVPLPTGCSLELDFGLVAHGTVNAGSYAVNVDADAATISGQAPDINDQGAASFTVREGALVIEKTPSITNAEVGDTVNWTVTVRNSGLGGLFDVEMDETALLSQAGLSLTSIVPSEPVTPAPSVNGDVATVGYLSPNQSFIATVSASVDQCTGLTNTAATAERNGRASASATASVKLDLKTPNVGFTVSTSAVPFNGNGSITVTLTNNGDGPANNFVLSSNIEGAAIDFVSASPGWSYSNGDLTKTSGPIAAGATEVVTILVKDTADVCTVVDSATLTFLAEYEDDCGTDFTTPNTLATINLNQEPDIEVEGGAYPRLALNESGSYNITISAIEHANIDDDPVVVTHTLPGAIIDGTSLSPSAGTVTCGGACGAGDLVTWSIPRASLNAVRTLTVGITATGESCDAGAEYITPINVSTSFAGNVCPISDVDAAGFLLSANPFTAPQQTFNQTGSTFETGSPDDGDDIQQEGEGEQAYFVATYLFDASDPGVWTGSEYSDGFGGVSQAVLNASTLEYNLNNTGWTAVPGGSVTGGTGSFSFTLDFLAGVDSGDHVAGDDLKIRYQLTAPDAVLAGGEEIYRSQFNELRIAMGLINGASCPVGDDAVYRQGDRVRWRRAVGEVQVSLNDEIIDVCEVSNATVSINNRTNEFGIRNLLARLNLGSDYELVTPSNPTFSGGLGGGASVTYNSADPSFTLDDEKLLSAGVATIQVRRKATATNSGGAISATIDYDDMETAPVGSRAFSASSSDAPTLVNQANLDVFVSPKDLPAVGSTVQWEITVRNTDSGVAYGTELEDVVPAGLIVNASDITAMDAANPGFAVTHNTGTLSWTLGDIAPGESEKITVQASFTGTTCAISNGPANQISSSWGCGGFKSQDVSAARPNMQFPAANLQILHDTTGAYANLCGAGEIIIIVNNAGLSEVTDVVVTEMLNTGSTGISLTPGSIQYSTNEGGSWSNAGAVTAGSTLTFDQSNVPPLALLSSNGVSGSKVLIKFGVTTTASTNASSAVTVSGTASLHCGDPVTSSGSTFNVPIDKPSLRVTKVGRNLTTGASNSENVYAAPGDTVEWTVTVTNEGDIATQELRFRDLLAGSNGSAIITGPGLNKTVTSLYEDVPQLGTGQSAVYTITETIGSTCVNDTNDADVTWGCVAQPSGQASQLSTPVANADSANLIMRPAATNIAITQQVNGPGGVGSLTTAGQISVVIANTGAPFTSADLQNSLPSGFRYDPSFTPTLTNTDTGSDAYNAVTVDASTPSNPEFTFTRSGGSGYLRNGHTMTLTFAIYQDGSLDTAGDPDVDEEDVGSSDPAVPVDSAYNATLNFQSGCGVTGTKAGSITVLPRTPDLDVRISNPAGAVFVSGTGATQSYSVLVSNNGETQAENGSLEINVGGGWSGGTPTGCTGSIPGALTCDLSGANALGAGSTRTFTINLTVANETNPLDISANVTGTIVDSANADTGGDYSYDEIETFTLGFRQTAELHATSEADFATANDLQIGEEATLRVTSVWFGGGASLIENPEISVNFERLSEMLYISETVTTGQTITGQTNFGGGAPNDIVYQFADFTGGATITIDLVTRVHNNANTTDGKSFDFVSNATSKYSGDVFDENSPGYTPAVDRTDTVTFRRPTLTAQKQVRNKTLSGTFADTATGDAGDVFEYRVVLTNTGNAPAFDLSVIDTVPNDFSINDLSADSLDNDNDGSTDEAQEGSVSAQVITFNRGTTNEGKLASLPNGQSLTLLYEVTAQTSVQPNIDAVNSADYLFDTLDGATGSQTAPTGTNNAVNGAFEDGGNVTATVTIVEIGLSKRLVTTSVGGDDATDVLVGEQATFELSVSLPAGTVNTFVIKDILPEGLALVSRSPISYGASVSCPTVSETPASLPASGTPLTASWDLGTCNISVGSDADRSITITYVAQVENIAAVTNGIDLENLADFTHAVTTDAVEATPVTLSVIEPQLTLSHSIAPNSDIDSGDLVELTYTLANAGTAPIFDVDLFTLFNDNGVASGPDGNVDITSAFGSAARDIEFVDCSAAILDTSAGLGDFTFSIVPDGDNDADVNDGISDCATRYLNLSTDGLAAGQSVTFKTSLIMSPQMILDTNYLLSAGVIGTSLPVGAPGADDAAYERSSANDASSSTRYSRQSSAAISTRTMATSTKTFVATTDVNTTPDNGSAVDVAVGETYTAQITYPFNEGITRRVRLSDRVRLQGPNIPADVDLVRAQIARSTTDLTSEDNPGSVNGSAATIYVDVTADVESEISGTWRQFYLDLGDVTHSGTGGTAIDGQNAANFTMLFEFRVMDATDNKDSLQLRDQGRVRRYDASDNSLGYRNGQTRNATIVEPSFVAAKASSDADGILSDGEFVNYVLTATNQGTGPAYNTIIEDVLPPSLRANGLTGVNISIDGSAPTSAPVFSYNAATGVAQWAFSDADVVLPGDAIVITYTAEADANVPAGTVHTNAFSVAAYYSQEEAQPVGRRQKTRSNTASVTLGAPEIAFRPDHTNTVQPGSSIVYPHQLTLPSSLSGASLTFSNTSSQSLEWTVWYDADGNGVLSGGDQAWVNGSAAPATGELQFFVQGQIPANAHDGWRDISTFTVNVVSGSVNLSSEVTDITNVNALQAGELTAGKYMAVDRDCDGSLADENVGDATFETSKDAAPGECVIYRISFQNTGTGSVTNVDVRDFTPAYTVYMNGTAVYETTPPSLIPQTVSTPAANENGALSFPYSGSLPSGQSGSVAYGVKIND